MKRFIILLLIVSIGCLIFIGYKFIKVSKEKELLQNDIASIEKKMNLYKQKYKEMKKLERTWLNKMGLKQYPKRPEERAKYRRQK